MIRAMIFDMDGTLVQTERLKAVSYARAAMELCPGCVTEEEVREAYKAAVGHSRKEVSQILIERLSLEEALAEPARARGLEPWEVFVNTRLGYYEAMLADRALLQEHQLLHNVALLRHARERLDRIGLATTSDQNHTRQILTALGIRPLFDLIVTADDVERTKPDPEAYQLILRTWDLAPRQALVIEDSLAGLKAAHAAGVRHIAVPTEFSAEAVRAAGLVEDRWIVEDPDALLPTVEALMEQERVVDERP